MIREGWLKICISSGSAEGAEGHTSLQAFQASSYPPNLHLLASMCTPHLHPPSIHDFRRQVSRLGSPLVMQDKDSNLGIPSPGGPSSCLLGINVGLQ